MGRMLENKLVIVTGASSGIGEATAKILASEGALVGAIARRKEKLESVVQAIAQQGGTAQAFPCDVGNRAEVNAVVSVIAEQFGRTPECLVNCAGVMPVSFIKKLSVDDWQKTVNINLMGVLYMTAAVLPFMLEKKSGHIINISSVAGRKVVPGGAVYSATKYAVNAFTEGLRLELSPTESIRTTIIEPGAVDTELPNSVTDSDMQAIVGSLFQQKILNPDDIARAILYAILQPPHVSVNEVFIRPTVQDF